MSTYIVTFGRLGRGAPPEPFTVAGDDADEIAFHILPEARKRLMSADVNVVVDLEKMTVNVYSGFHSTGVGALELVP